MIILNLGCGFVRPQTGPWINVDMLKSQLAPGTPERIHLDHEQNYIDHDIRKPLPFSDAEVDGVFSSHTVEHLDAQEAVAWITECKRVLKPGGVLCVSVPNAGYFKAVNPQDNKANCQRLFGEPMPESETKQSFLEYALLFGDHKQVLCEDSLWCLFVGAGFPGTAVAACTPAGWHACNIRRHFLPLANRFAFSLFMEAVKSGGEQ